MSAKRGTLRACIFKSRLRRRENWCAFFAGQSSMWPSTYGEVLLPTAGTWLLLSMLQTARNCGCHRVFFMVSVLSRINTEVLYKVTAYYSPAHDSGVHWNDPALEIDWPLPPDAVLLSDKDQRHPRLAELPDFFVYQEESCDPAAR
jgi:dTDP-4-dehydrorhamnose 3,5-epimerase